MRADRLRLLDALEQIELIRTFAAARIKYVSDGVVKTWTSALEGAHGNQTAEAWIIGLLDRRGHSFHGERS
jgi:hypothetical protein